MKRIAVTQRLIENDSYFELRTCLDMNWYRFLKAIDAVPIPVPYYINLNKFISELNVEGIIFTGGNDLNSVTPNKLSKLRDKFEYKLLTIALQKGIPIIGICRGMQLLANFYNLDLVRVDNHCNSNHNITHNLKAKTHNYISQCKMVNSYHNYGIKGENEEIRIVASDSQGHIEAFEHKSLPVFCQMWHPERQNSFLVHEVNFFCNFFNTKH